MDGGHSYIRFDSESVRHFGPRRRNIHQPTFLVRTISSNHDFNITAKIIRKTEKY